MTKILTILAAAAFLAFAGCEDNKHDHMHGNAKTTSGSMKPAMMMADACPTCPGVQTVTADGKCPSCGAAVADVCSHCPGVQVATADGKCPSCGMAVAK